MEIHGVLRRLALTQGAGDHDKMGLFFQLLGLEVAHAGKLHLQPLA
jgi:hypothetical protein